MPKASSLLPATEQTIGLIESKWKRHLYTCLKRCLYGLVKGASWIFPICADLLYQCFRQWLSWSSLPECVEAFEFVISEIMERYIDMLVNLGFVVVLCLWREREKERDRDMVASTGNCRRSSGRRTLLSHTVSIWAQITIRGNIFVLTADTMSECILLLIYTFGNMCNTHKKIQILNGHQIKQSIIPTNDISNILIVNKQCCFDSCSVYISRDEKEVPPLPPSWGFFWVFCYFFFFYPVLSQQWNKNNSNLTQFSRRILSRMPLLFSEHHPSST